MPDRLDFGGNRTLRIRLLRVVEKLRRLECDRWLFLGVTMLDRRTLVLGLAAAGVATRVGAAVPRAITPQEMLGPFYPQHPISDQDFDLTQIRGHSGRAKGELIEFVGRVLRPDGTPIPHALIEVWQANAAGRYRHPTDANPAPLDPDFQGYARINSGNNGSFRFLTIKPGAYPAPVGIRTPHIHFDIQSVDCRFISQVYFPNEPLNSSDPFLSTMPMRHQDPSLLIAREEKGVTTARRFHWEAVLRS